MEEILKLLAEQGGLAIVLAVSLAGNIFLLRLLIKAKEDHLIDIKETKDTIGSTLVNIRDAQNSIRDSINLLTTLIEGHLRRNQEI